MTVFLAGCSESYNVRFVTNNNQSISDQLIEEENLISEPNELIKEGYDFNGWYQNPDFSSETLWRFDTDLVNDNIVLYAYWSPKVYDINIDYRYDNNRETIQHVYDSMLEITEPSREGYEFMGWYYDENYQVEADLSNLKPGNQSLYAEWTEKTYTTQWFDSDGILLSETSDKFGAIPEHSLPDNNENWNYLSWDREVTTTVGNTSYTAIREMNRDYFKGNVFQVLAKDLSQYPTGIGSGFVINDEGWFISNAHIFEGALYGDAYFEVSNPNEGQSFTILSIDEIFYYSPNRDFIIGRISNYDKLIEYYKPFSFTNEYEVGESVYTVGYPGEKTVYEINAGRILEDISTLSDKFIVGNDYIGTDAFIDFGSSGGMLINEQFEILGITTFKYTDENGDFDSAGVLSNINYLNQVNNINENELQDITSILYPDSSIFVNLYESIREIYQSGDSENLEYIVEYGSEYYEETYTFNDYNDDDVAYLSKSTYYYFPSGDIGLQNEISWASGDERFFLLYGRLSDKDFIASFEFEFYYEWGDGNYYSLMSDDINYSTDVNLTLINYDVDGDYTDSLIEYAKGIFNNAYEALIDQIEYYTNEDIR